MSEGPWSVPRCFEGGTVAVLASGESMSVAVADAIRSADVPAIAVNATFRLAPWAWAVYGADTQFWQHEQYRDARDFAGLKITIRSKNGPAPSGLLTLWHTGHAGIDEDPRCLRTGSNSGYQAVHIAIHTGAKRIILCGFDMQGGHWHGDHPHGFKINALDAFEKFRMKFAELAPLAKKRGIDIVNCTPDSALKCFRRASLADELETCIAR